MKKTFNEFEQAVYAAAGESYLVFCKLCPEALDATLTEMYKLYSNGESLIPATTDPFSGGLFDSQAEQGTDEEELAQATREVLALTPHAIRGYHKMLPREKALEIVRGVYALECAPAGFTVTNCVRPFWGYETDARGFARDWNEQHPDEQPICMNDSWWAS